MQLSLTNLVCVLFDPAIPTSAFNFIQLFLYLYSRDGPDIAIYVIHYKNLNNSEQLKF